MSSDLGSMLTSLRQNDYVSLAVLVAVGYDYVLTFSTEVEYVWSKPWTYVSTLYVLVRYCGLYTLVIPVLNETTFLPGPAKMYTFYFIAGLPIQLIYQAVNPFHGCFQGEIISIIGLWLYVLFLGAADFVMILRVWAMYNRSKLIISILLTFFFLEIAFIIITYAINSNPEVMSATTIQILHFSICVVQTASPIWTQVHNVVQMAFGVVICTLAIIQFMKQSLRTYRVTNRWQLNQYINLIVKEGIVYFFAIFLFNLLNILFVSGNIPSGGWQLILCLILEYVPVYTLSPRFILSMRELYARDAQAKQEGGIDNAFGLSSSGRASTGSTIVFADIEQNEGLVADIEEIPMDVISEGGTSQPS